MGGSNLLRIKHGFIKLSYIEAIKIAIEFAKSARHPEGRYSMRSDFFSPHHLVILSEHQYS